MKIIGLILCLTAVAIAYYSACHPEITDSANKILALVAFGMIISGFLLAKFSEQKKSDRYFKKNFSKNLRKGVR